MSCSLRSLFVQNSTNTAHYCSLLRLRLRGSYAAVKGPSDWAGHDNGVVDLDVQAAAGKIDVFEVSCPSDLADQRHRAGTGAASLSPRPAPRS